MTEVAKISPAANIEDGGALVDGDRNIINRAGKTTDVPADSGLADVTLEYYGAVGDGVTDDSAAVLAFEASSRPGISLGGKTYFTTVATDTLTKNYYGAGKLITENANSNEDWYPKQYDVAIVETRKTGRKSPTLTWDGLATLGLGTSIPQQGEEIDSYMTLAGNDLGFSYRNMSWAGSSVTFPGINPTGFDPMGSVNQVKKLSMTQADVDAGLALHGAGTVFDDAYDPITKASEMTLDHRIKAEFELTDFDVVFLDHNHNDRRDPEGTLTPSTTTVSNVAVGATTVITVGSTTGIAVGDGVFVTGTGQTGIDYLAGRVTAVGGSSVTVGYDSSALTGGALSGTLTIVDRSTIYGALDFTCAYIENAKARYGTGSVTIVLCGAPSLYTNGVFSADIRSVNEKIAAYAEAKGYAFFDVEESLRIGDDDHAVYLPDNVHPTTAETRRVIANHWVDWLSGGSARTYNEKSLVRKRTGETFADQTPAVYSEGAGAMIGASRFEGTGVVEHSDDWTSGLGGYTTTGTPSIVTAPWDAGASALLCQSTAGTPAHYVTKTISMTDGVDLTFEFYMPVVSGLTSVPPATMDLVRLETTSGYLVIQAIVYSTSTVLRAIYFQTPGADVVNLPSVDAEVTAATLHTIQLKSMKEAGGIPGYLSLYLDGNRISGPWETADSGQGTITAMDLGAGSSNVGGPVDLYFGDVTLNEVPIVSAFDGTIATGSLPVVRNGVVVDETPSTIVEQGSTANGEYVKFYDGTMFCWHVLTMSNAGGKVWTFPEAFISAPTVTGTSIATVVSSLQLDAAPSATSATLSAWSSIATRQAVNAHLKASGRWK